MLKTMIGYEQLRNVMKRYQQLCIHTICKNHDMATHFFVEADISNLVLSVLQTE
jgi:hypothetical protein